MLRTKICSKCGVEKILDDFKKSEKRMFGVFSWCKSCDSDYSKIYRAIHKEKIKVSQKIYRKKHKEEKRIRDKAYHEAHKEEKRARDKLYRKTHREKCIAYDKIYYKAHAKERKVQGKIYRKNNKDIIKARDKKYYHANVEKQKLYRKIHAERYRFYKKTRYKTDPKYKLNHNISVSIRGSLKNGKGGVAWLKLVDYTLQDLKKHLEKQFVDGMSWENHGKNGWEIDHKIPISVFNFTKPEHMDFKRCWALKNLQPMWAKDNLEKKAKLDNHFQPSLPI